MNYGKRSGGTACEGFFDRFKNEFFYGRDWRGVTLEELPRLLEIHRVLQ